MSSPYESFPEIAFWRKGVQGSDPTSMLDIYTRKFEIRTTDSIATAGSCFAQHIARHMRATGYTVVDMEPPLPGMSASMAKNFGYNLYSARYGNIYTARQLLQLLKEADGSFSPQNLVWEKDGMYFDALRPSVEPEGLKSPEEVLEHRRQHINAVQGMLRRTNVFIFTLGLTEAWVHGASGTIYPTAPETIAGRYDPNIYQFKNFTIDEVLSDMREAFHIFTKHSPNVKFLLTVSPVPLTATASGQHVLRATVYSKSVLRVAAETLASEFGNVDYFPSFEIIMNPGNRTRFFESNLRSVAPEGVESVMKVFLNAHHTSASPVPGLENPITKKKGEDVDVEDDVVCEEMLLDAFGDAKK